jgi:hypothetical protein
VLGPQVGSLVFGTSGSATYACQFNYSSTAATTATITVAGLPSGVTPKPATVTVPTGTGTDTFTLTLTTSGGANGTPANNNGYSFTCTVTDGNPINGTDTLVVGQQALTVTGITAKNKVYDATTSATINTSKAKLNGVVTGDTNVSLDTSNATGAFADKNVAYDASGNVINKTVNVSGLKLSGSNASDYFIAPATASAKITPATLTITAHADTKTYDGTTNSSVTPTYQVANLPPNTLYVGDTLTGLSQSFASKDVSVSPLQVHYTINDTNNGGDYAVTLQSATGTIKPLAVTLAGSRTYDGTATAAASILKVSNAIGSDTVNVASGSATLAGKNVGSQAITSLGTLALSNNAAGDYTLTGATGSVTITKANATVQVTGYTGGTYDGTEHTQTVTVTGVGTDGVLFTDSLSGTKAGDYSKNWSFSNGNYNAAGESGTLAFTIDKANAVISVTGVSTTYDGAGHAASGSASGVESPTPANLTSELHLSYSTDGGKNFSTSAPVSAGTYEVYYTFDGDTNYNAVATETDSGKAVAINPARLVIQTNAATAQAGGSLTFTVTPSGLVNNETVSVFTGTLSCAITDSKGAVVSKGIVLNQDGTVWDGSSNAPSQAGQYLVTPSGVTDKNYIIVFKPGVLTVTAAPVSTDTLSVSTGDTLALKASTVSATITNGNSPTGTLTFSLYQGGTILNSYIVSVNGNGAYSPDTSSLVLPAGAYNWVVSYSGDAQNGFALGTSQFTVAKGTPTLALDDSTFGIDNTGTVTITANLSGTVSGISPNSSVTFAVYDSQGNQVGSALVTDSGALTLTAAITTTIDPLDPTMAGTYYIIASFNGDANYAPTSSDPHFFTVSIS